MYEPDDEAVEDYLQQQAEERRRAAAQAEEAFQQEMATQAQMEAEERQWNGDPGPDAPQDSDEDYAEPDMSPDDVEEEEEDEFARRSPDLERSATPRDPSSSNDGGGPSDRRGTLRPRAHPVDTAGQDGDGDAELDSSWGGSRYGQQAAAPAAAPAPAPPPAPRRGVDVPGYKRQRIKAPTEGPEAVEYKEMRISDVRRMPCVVHNYMPTFRPWDDERASFSLLMSGRMAKEREYKVPLDNFLEGSRDKDPEDDGLANWILGRLRGMLPVTASVNPLRSRVEEVTRMLHAALTSDPMDRGIWCVTSVVLELPFVRRVYSVFVSAYSSAEGGHRGLDIDDEYVRLDDHRNFRIQTYAELCEGAKLTVKFADCETGDEATIQVRPRGGAQLQLPGTDDWHWLSVPGNKCEQLVLPQEWGLREVARVRRLYGHPSHNKDTMVDPIRLAMLAAACAGDKEYGRWVFLLQLASAGMFAGSKTTTSAGKDHLELYNCSEETGLWARDHSSLAFEKLLRRVQRDISNLAMSIERARETLLEGLEADYFERDEVANMVSDKIWEQVHGEAPEDGEDSKASYEKLKETLLAAITNEEEHNSTLVRDQLCFLLQRLSPEFGKSNLNVYNMRNEFVKTVVVEGGTIELDTKRVINFKNGVCWDAEILAFRKIRPQDFSSLTVGYDKPEADPVGQGILMDFFRQVHPLEEVLQYKLGLKARALTQNQADPVILCSQGVGGGCKSLEARLTRACLGDDGKGGGYALSLNSQVLTPCKSESVNSASPVMMSLKNKIFVSSDEVGNFDSDLVKKLTGGEPVTARNMYSGLESFTPRFPVIELLSNKSADANKRARFKVDSGIQRRVKGIFYDSKFEDAASAEEARTLLNERAALPEGQQDLTEFEQQDLMPITDGPPPPPAVPPPCTNAREGYEGDERAYCASFGRFMFPERHDKLMELKGQFLLMLCDIHARSEAPGGPGWPKQPDIIDQWTSETLVAADDGDNAFEEWMDATYERCDCVPGPSTSDATAPTSEELFEYRMVPAGTIDQPNRTRMEITDTQCTHCQAISDIVKKMRRRDVPGASNFFVQECGGGTQKKKTAQLLKKIDAVACFRSRKHLSPTDANNPNLVLKPSEPGLRVGNKVNVLRGLKLRSETLADLRDKEEREARQRAELAQFGEEEGGEEVAEAGGA